MGITRTRKSSQVADAFESEAAFQLAMARSSAVASSSMKKSRKKESHMNTISRMRRKEIELEMYARQAQLKFLEALEKMNKASKISTLFNLFDINGSGEIDACELALTMRKMSKSDHDFEESLNIATLTIAAFDEDNDVKLNEDEFTNFLASVGAAENRENIYQLNDVVQYMAMQATFPDGNDSVLGQVMDIIDAGVLQEAGQAYIHSGSLASEARLLVMFQMFDYHQEGVIRFSDVSGHLSKYIEQCTDIPKDTEQIMQGLLINESAHRTLNFPQFMYLMVNVQTCSNNTINFFTLADDVTLSVCRELIGSDGNASRGDRLLSSMMEATDLNDGVVFSETGKIDTVTKQRLDRLFNLWDLDGNRFVDLKELILGLRKFHEAKDLDTTVEDSIAALMKADKNNDNQLDHDEFASLLFRWAYKMNVDLHELIDFMVVRSALKDNDAEEKQYVQTVRTLKPDNVKQRHSSSSTNTTIFGFLKTLQSEVA